MKLSTAGLDLIKEFEGYHDTPADLRKKGKPVPDGIPEGGCVAYRCPANVVTLGWGCTEGVTEGMIVSAEQATAMLATEMAKHEAAVDRLVKVTLTQGQYDALVSFSYNCGAGNLEKSTLLKLLNAGDYDGARAQFSKWTKAAGVELAGLVRRRAREAEVFGAAVQAPRMAQRVEAPATPVVNSQTSRTFSLAEKMKQLQITLAAAPFTWAGLDNIQATKSYADAIAAFASKYGVWVMIVGCVVMYVAAEIFQELKKQDVAAGRSTPSGAGKATP